MTEHEPSRHSAEGRTRLPGRGAVFVSVGLSILGSAWLLVVPAISRIELVERLGSPTLERTTTEVALTAEHGWRAILLLALPVLIAVAPLVPSRARYARLARVVAAALLIAFAGITAASIGLFFGPSAAVMALAAARGWRRLDDFAPTEP